MTPNLLLLVLVIWITTEACATPSSPSSSDAGTTSSSPSARQTVQVLLKNGGSETFEYVGFSGFPDWVRENGTCTSYQFSKNDISSIEIYSRRAFSCSSGAVYYEVSINGRTGSDRCGSGCSWVVSGNDLNGTRKTVRWQDIASIRFNR